MASIKFRPGNVKGIGPFYYCKSSFLIEYVSYIMMYKKGKNLDSKIIIIFESILIILQVFSDGFCANIVRYIYLRSASLKLYFWSAPRFNHDLNKSFSSGIRLWYCDSSKSHETTRQYVEEATEPITNSLDRLHDKVDILLPNKKRVKDVGEFKDKLGYNLYPQFMANAGNFFQR